MPSPKDMKLQIAYTMLTNPMFEGMFASMWGEDQVPKRPDSLVDESIAEFVKRRSGGNKKPVENIISAVLHGIYAGDVNQLSARSLMSELWAWEGEYGSLTQGMVRSRRARGGGTPQPPQPYADGAVSQELGERANNASIYTFQNGGMQTFPDALEGVIREQKNAVIKTETRVSGIKRSEDGKSIQVCATPSPS
jgi:oxygen-dependent protoporphyrinogen oxidase